MRRALPDGRQIALSGRLWALLGLLALSPLLSELAFSLWNVRAYTEEIVDGVLDAAFYTLLPFVFVLLGRAATRGRAAFTAPGA